MAVAWNELAGALAFPDIRLHLQYVCTLAYRHTDTPTVPET